MFAFFHLDWDSSCKHGHNRGRTTHATTCPGCPSCSKRFLSQFDRAPKQRSVEPLLHKFEGVTTVKMLSGSRILRAHRNHVDIQHFTD